MAVNLNANAFTNQTQNDYAKKQVAESYMQVYQYAAEDFTSHPDIRNYITDLTNWMRSVDQRLTKQMQLISTHTHKIPPHGHSVTGHSLAIPVPLTTLTPVQSKAIKWSAINYPIYVNTTLTEPNYSGNRITVSKASEGSIVPTIRRMKEIPLTLIPRLAPVLQDSLKAGVGS